MLFGGWRETQIESEIGTRYHPDNYIDTKLGLLIYPRGIRQKARRKIYTRLPGSARRGLLKGEHHKARLEIQYQYKI
jgi:hypothetical protein